MAITSQDIPGFSKLAKSNVEEFLSQWSSRNPNKTVSDAAISHAFYASYDDKNATTNFKPMFASIGGSSGGGSSGGGSSVTGGGSFSGRKLPGAGTEAKSIFDLFGIITDSSSVVAIGQKIIKETVGQLILNLEQEANLHRQIAEQTSMSVEFVDAMTPSIMDAYRNATLLGYSFEEVTGAVTKTFTDAGRFKMVSEDTMSSLTKTSRLFYDNLAAGAESIANFQNISLGAKEAMDAAYQVGRKSMSLGLNARETVRVLNKEITRLNQFGFKGGIEGLTRMVQKAQELRMDMTKTFDLADKVMDPTKALELAANLQVIGGAMGEFQDPIKLMYMATNDVEGLQDALVGTVESLVTFNQESGRFEIVGANLRRLRATAEALGMDYKELGNTTVQAAQRSSAAADLMMSSLVFENEEDKEFLTNLAQMKGGRMVIEVPDELQKTLGREEIALEEMTQDQFNQLKDMRDKMDDMEVDDLLKTQVHYIDNIDRKLTWLMANLRGQFGAAGEEIAKQLDISWTAAYGIIEKKGNVAIKATEDLIKAGTQVIIGAGKEMSDTDVIRAIRELLLGIKPSSSGGGTEPGSGHGGGTEPGSRQEGGTEPGSRRGGGTEPGAGTSGAIYYNPNEENKEIEYKWALLYDNILNNNASLFKQLLIENELSRISLNNIDTNTSVLPYGHIKSSPEFADFNKLLNAESLKPIKEKETSEKETAKEPEWTTAQNKQSKTVYLRFIADNSILDPIARAMARNPDWIDMVTDQKSYVAPTGFNVNS